jgi:hypothetical protein
MQKFYPCTKVDYKQTILCWALVGVTGFKVLIQQKKILIFSYILFNY